jgi:type II secretory pathway pseudopilin PulG
MVEPSPAPVNPAAPPKKSALSCLVIGLCVAGGGVVLIAILAALLLPAIARATERAMVTSCANNLRQMHSLQTVYMAQFGGPKKLMPEETGSEFWLKLTKTTPPLVDSSEQEVFLCPVKGQPGGSKCDYLGPAAPALDLKATDPLGADHPGNHKKGGNVLHKAGDIVELLDPEFTKQIESLKP